MNMIWKLTLKHLLSKPLSAFLTLLAVAASLALLGLFWTLVENLERVRVRQQSSVEATQPMLTIFADPKLSKGELASLKTKLVNDKRFSNLDEVPPAESMKALELQFGETLTKVFDPNSLPVTLKARFANATLSREEFVSMLNQVRSLPGVIDVDDGLAVVPTPQGSSVANRLFSWTTAFLIVVFFVVALLVSHLIRIAFETTRTDVETMKVMGVPKYWMFLPILFEGLFFGIAGTLISMLSIMGVVHLVLPRYAAILLPQGVEVMNLSTGSLLSLLGFGIAAALAGSLMTWPMVARKPTEI